MVRTRGSYDPIVFRAERVGCKEVISLKKSYFNKEVKHNMLNITNIDAIIELILREARSRAGQDLTFHVYRVCMEIQTRIMEVMDKAREEERRKEKEEKDDAWSKGM